MRAVKAVKVVVACIGAFFFIAFVNLMIEVGEKVSFDNVYVLALYWGFVIALLLTFVVYPLYVYYQKPSVYAFEKMMRGDKKATRKFYSYYIKTLKGEEKEKISKIPKNNDAEIQAFAKEKLAKSVASFDLTIRNYALKLTATVMISPNSFIDGLAIVFGNSRMMYELSQKIDLRYNLKDMLKYYFSLFTVATSLGLIEEFDEAIEEMFQSLIEEFSEYMAEEVGINVSDKVPLLNIFVKSISPILQAAGNYAFILYSGKRFKYNILNLIAEEKTTDEAIKKRARKEARHAKYNYIEEMIKKMSVAGKDKFKEKISSKAIFKNKSTF